MHHLLLKIGDGGGERLAGIVIVAELLYSCLYVKSKVLLDDIIDDA